MLTACSSGAVSEEIDGSWLGGKIVAVDPETTRNAWQPFAPLYITGTGIWEEI